MAASQRAAQKRTANAMPTDERAAKRLADQQQRRRVQRERRQAAAVPVAMSHDRSGRGALQL